MVKLTEVADEHFEEVAHSTSDFENDDDFEDYESGDELEENLSESGITETTATTQTTDQLPSRRRRGGGYRSKSGAGNASGKGKRRGGGGGVGGARSSSMRENLESDTYWANLGRDKRRGGRNVMLDEDEEEEEEEEEEGDTSDDDDDNADLFEETLMERIIALKDIMPIAHRERINSVVGGFLKIGGKVARFGGKLVFVASTSMLFLGVPYALAVTEEQGMLEMEKEMKLQQQASELISGSTGQLGGGLLGDVGGKKP